MITILYAINFYQHLLLSTVQYKKENINTNKTEKSDCYQQTIHRTDHCNKKVVISTWHQKKAKRDTTHQTNTSVCFMYCWWIRQYNKHNTHWNSYDEETIYNNTNTTNRYQHVFIILNRFTIWECAGWRNRVFFSQKIWNIVIEINLNCLYMKEI